jgi:predicted ATPase/class 3 adenylate cyclase
LSDVANRPSSVTATFLFTDIEGSTKLARRLGQARWIETMSAHHEIVREAITAHHGRVDHTEGDAFVAVFSDAADAVAAATQAQRGLAEHTWPDGTGALRVRMGLHTGVVVAHSTGYLGLDAHLAARVATAANGGQTLITTATLEAAGRAIEVRDLGAHRLKDFPEAERLYHVVVEGFGDAVVPPPRTASARPTNLPPQTRELVGRSDERAALRGLLQSDSGQLVTVTGIGGMGKTRLALAVGHELLDDFPGGVFLIRLAGVRDEQSIAPMIAQAVGVTGQSDRSLVRVLAQRLAEQPTLIILDNFEQLTSGAGVLTELLGRGAALRMLVTSQVPLRLGAERIVSLGPLAPSDGVSLFIERARQVVPNFVADGDERATIDEICDRLDQMPLAIELAAARVGSLSPQVLARRLDRPLGLLTRGATDAPERQRSLRATIEWTHALLDPAAQALFARLGAFAGSVPLTAVEAIAEPGSDPTETLDRLEDLLEFSFVRRREDRRLGVRFLVPQALRDYAAEELVERGEEDEVRRLHAEYVAGVAYAARLWKWGASAERRLDLQAVLDEIRPAVAWARERDPELHVRICAAISSYWVYAGVLSELADELRRALESESGSEAERASMITILAKCAQLRHTDEDSGKLTDQAIAAWRSVDDERERALGLGPLSWVLRWEPGRAEEAIAAAREALAVLRRTDDRLLILRGLVFLAHALADTLDVPATEAVLVEADELAGGDPIWELAAIHADCESYRGDDVRALELYSESLSWTSTTGESHQMLMDLRCHVMCLARLGHGEPALEIQELVRLEEERTGRIGDSPIYVQWFTDAVAVARDLVTPAIAQSAVERARAVPVTDRAAHAIGLARDIQN